MKTLKLNREDFTYTVERHGAYGGWACRILYKGQWLYGFGTSPDGTGKRSRRNHRAISEHADATIQMIMSGLSPAATKRIAQIEKMEKVSNG